jgi:hypothetical protein
MVSVQPVVARTGRTPCRYGAVGAARRAGTHGLKT